MEIKRNVYLYKLIHKQGNGLIKVITGVRRCGKSYLLNTIFLKYLLENGVAEDHIIRFAFDSADDLQLIGEDLLALQEQQRECGKEKMCGLSAMAGRFCLVLFSNNLFLYPHLAL